MHINLNIKKEMFNEAYLPYLNNPERFTVFYGGAGSGKSVFAVQKMVYKYLKDKRTCLVCRSTLASIRESIFQEYLTCLSKFGILPYCKVNLSTYTITLPNGSKFIFKGLDDREKIKSISGLDDIMIEEATQITLDDFTQLNLRLRSKAKNQQVVLMFNPVSKSNWVYKHFFENGTPKDTVIVHTTWRDNKFLPPSYISSLEQMKKSNPIYYKIYALGEFATLNKLIYTNCRTQQFDYRSLLKDREIEALFGMDFGYTNDPSAFICILVHPRLKKIWVFDEHYERGMLNSDIKDMIERKGFLREIITADSSEKKSIDELKKLGVTRMRPARKGKDSILHGIQFLQQFEIIVHPKCANTWEELENYCWQKDKKSEEYVNKPIDEFNHLMDALRYAVEDLSRGWRLKTLDKSQLGL